LATALGEDEDAMKYQAARRNYTALFNERYYNAQNGTFDLDMHDPMIVQSISSTALRVGVVPEAQVQQVVNALKENIMQLGITVGATGSQHLLGALAENGANEVAAMLATSQQYPSWGHWLTQNATTCWESWSGVSDGMHPSGDGSFTNPPTHNHIFLCGGVGEYLYQGFAGIVATEPGYRTVAIAPRISQPEAVPGAKASVRTVRGTVQAEWQCQTSSHLSLSVVVPVHVEAHVSVPFLGLSARDAIISVIDDDGSGMPVFENGACKTALPWGLQCQADNATATFTTASGRYTFVMQQMAIV